MPASGMVNFCKEIDRAHHPTPSMGADAFFLDPLERWLEISPRSVELFEHE